MKRDPPLLRSDEFFGCIFHTILQTRLVSHILGILPTELADATTLVDQPETTTSSPAQEQLVAEDSRHPVLGVCTVVSIGDGITPRVYGCESLSRWRAT